MSEIRKTVNKLKTSDGIQIKTMSELRNHADSEFLFRNFCSGTLFKWCEENHLESELEEFSELSNDIVKSICDIFNIEYSGMNICSLFESETENSGDKSELEKRFEQYAGERINFSNYDIELNVFDAESMFYGSVELKVHNILTELFVECIVPMGSGEQAETEFFERVIKIIGKTEEIGMCCSLDLCGSGGYGYGLELI